MEKLEKLKKSMLLDDKLAKYGWPIMRLFIKSKLSKRCTRCTLNENYVKIIDGLCEICRSSDPKIISGGVNYIHCTESEQDFNSFIKSYQGKGKGSYDAIVYFSGGKDSIYILYRLKKENPNLRLLALTIDNGFRSPFGKENSELICKALNIDHMEIRPYAVYKRLYRYGFERFRNYGWLATDVFEGELFQDIGRNLALKLEIPLLILGYTKEQLSVLKSKSELDNYGIYNISSFKNQQQAFKREEFLGEKLTDMFTSEQMSYWWDGTSISQGNLPTMVYPFLVWDYNKSEIEKYVYKLGLTKIVMPELTNDLYTILGMFIDYKILGYCSMEPEWVKHVRDGKSDRKSFLYSSELVEYLALHNENLIKDSLTMQIVLEGLEMTWEDIKAICRKD